MQLCKCPFAPLPLSPSLILPLPSLILPFPLSSSPSLFPYLSDVGKYGKNIISKYVPWCRANWWAHLYFHTAGILLIWNSLGWVLAHLRSAQVFASRATGLKAHSLCHRRKAGLGYHCLAACSRSRPRCPPALCPSMDGLYARGPSHTCPLLSSSAADRADGRK